MAIKLVLRVVILNHFPGDKTVFYGLYLTLVFVVTVQSGNIAHIRILMVMHDSFNSITRYKAFKPAATLPFEAMIAMMNIWNCVYNQ